jgi:hypothetical protein
VGRMSTECTACWLNYDRIAQPGFTRDVSRKLPEPSQQAIETP